MSRKIDITAEIAYSVYLTDHWREELQALTALRSRCAVVTTQFLKDRIGNLDSGDCEFFYFIIPEGEEGKSFTTLLKLWDWLAAAGFTRSDLIVAIGGGAVTDVAGFAASSYLRGVEWVAIPTTVAGAVDAAVGGKTGINSDYGKNLIGAFYSPIQVITDISWFDTLSDRDFSAGLAEVIKCGFISDPVILDLLATQSLATLRENKTLQEEIVYRAVQVKAKVVSTDFKESFDREILNYGHTFGHAVEKHSLYKLRHGECVAIGMAFIAHLQLELGLISGDICDLHLKLLTQFQLPTSYSQASWLELLPAMKLDKKSRGSTLRFVTISEIGKTHRLENPSEQAMLRAYEKVCL